MNNLNDFIVEVVKKAYEENKNMTDFILNVMYTFKISGEDIINIYEKSMFTKANEKLVNKICKVISDFFNNNITEEDKRLLKSCAKYTRKEDRYSTLIYLEGEIFKNGNDIDCFDEQFEDFYVYANYNLDYFIYVSWYYRDYRKQIVDNIMQLPLKQEDREVIEQELKKYGYDDLSENLCTLLANILFNQDSLTRYRILFYVDEHIKK